MRELEEFLVQPDMFLGGRIGTRDILKVDHNFFWESMLGRGSAFIVVIKKAAVIGGVDGSLWAGGGRHR